MTPRFLSCVTVKEGISTNWYEKLESSVGKGEKVKSSILCMGISRK